MVRRSEHDDGCESGWADGQVDGAWANGAWGKGQYCGYFCAIDDLWCERANETAADNCTAASRLPALPPAPSTSRPPAAPTLPGRPSAG